MYKKTLAELIAGLEAGEFSSVELTQMYLERIKRWNPELNAFITITEELALTQAKQADQQRHQGKGGLTGVPIAHKDLFCSQGVRSSCGSKMLDNFIAPYNATVVENLQQAGMVLLGKTNMDEFAMGSSNETSYYGCVKNPWDVSKVPGGSSGGSAAAVAARLAPASTGTDTGGSIRQPASLCGITGLKPTYGRVSRYGMVAFASSLDQAGPMTQTAEDAALLLQAMAGFDAKDSTCVPQEVPDYLSGLNNDIAGLTLGLPKEYFAEGLDDEVASTVQQAISELQKLGAKLVDIELPHSHLSIPTYYVVAPAECSSNLARYDGVRFGYRCQNPKDLEDLYKRSRSEGLGAEVQRRIMIGTYVLSSGYYDAYYLQAQKVRQLIRQDFQQAFEKVDMIVAPTSPTVAFALGDKFNDPVTMYLSDIDTIAVNLAGLPAMSIPAGFSQQLPVGLQLIGNYFDEAKLLNVAHSYQQQTDWHCQISDGFNVE